MIDMHTHSSWSDGEDSPRTLVERAKAAGLSGLALTDHDTMAGIAELEEAGRTLGFSVYDGIEISCTQWGTNRPLHVLGYAIPLEGRTVVEGFCANIRRARDAAVRESAARLERAGYPVSVVKVEALAGAGGQLCKQYIMGILMEAGLCDAMYGPLYRELFKTGKKGAPPVAALTFETVDPVAAVRCVVAAGGKAVLAHPGQYGNFDAVPTLVEAGLSGIEAYHPKHDASTVEHCLALARQYDLAITGGSDYHGVYGEGERLGERGMPLSRPSWD